MGSGGVVLTSPDGITWISRNSGTSDALLGVIYGDSIFVAVGENSSIIQSEPVTYSNNCSATLSSSLSLHVPVIFMNGAYYQADLQLGQGYPSNIIFSVITVAEVAQGNCGSPATLMPYGNTFIVHIPSLVWDAASLWTDFEYIPTTDGLIWFKLVDYGFN